MGLFLILPGLGLIQVLWCWSSYLASLSLSSPICKMECACNCTFLPASLQGLIEIMYTQYLEAGLALSPPWSAVANIIRFVEQTNFAGAVQQKHPNMLSSILFIVLIVPSGPWSVFTGKGFCWQHQHGLWGHLGPLGCPSLKMPKPLSPQGDSRALPSVPGGRACGQQGWHSLRAG